MQTTLSVRIKDDLHEAIESTAKRERRRAADLIRETLREKFCTPPATQPAAH